MIGVAYGFDAKEYKAVQELIKSFPWAIEMGMKDSSVIARQKIVKRTPVDMGDARRSFGKPIRVSEFTYAIISNVGNGKNYTPFLELGTGICGPKKRAIKPPAGVTWRFPIVKKNTIKFWMSVGSKPGLRKDGTQKRTSLNGIKPHHMIRDTKKEMPQIIKDNINRTIQELIKKAASK